MSLGAPQLMPDTLRIVVKRLISAIADLAAVYDRGEINRADMPPGSGLELFPGIIGSSLVPRSNIWKRNTSQILEALPNKVVMNRLVDFYFSPVQVLRKLLALAQTKYSE